MNERTLCGELMRAFFVRFNWQIRTEHGVLLARCATRESAEEVLAALGTEGAVISCRSR